MGETKRNHGRQQGAQQHAEGDHGARTKAFLDEQLRRPLDPEQDGRRRAQPGTDAERHHAEDQERHSQYMSGESHLVGDYHPQHDEADLNSEKTRRARKEEREGKVPPDDLAARGVQASAKRKS